MTAVTASVSYRFGLFELQPEERRLYANGAEVRLGAHAFDLLVALVERGGHLVTKEELLGRVWGKVIVEENTLQSHIRDLRRALGSQAITTVSGRGYRFALEVTRSSPTATAASPKHNLPHALTSFIGREAEIAELSQLLGNTRLLTLTGSGGCGKTRLAIQLAKQQAHVYPEGAWLVELSALTDAGLLPQTIASVLGIEEKPGARLIDTIAEYLAPRTLLLVLDNADHLIEPCAQLSESLLQHCARLVVLATSRERLGITGEQTYRVPSLSVPDEESETMPESVAAYESARLFIDRARLQLPHFAITTQNSVAIASICRRLDGIALALELAAPRLRTISVEELSRGLDRRFELLTEGSRTALPRHRTLRALINWSYDLLSDAEKAMLRSVSVFAGGWTLEAAEHVSGVDPPDSSGMLDLLTSLTDKNLIAAETRDGATRYGMLETVRVYARERLSETSEQPQLQDRHLAFFLALAEQANREKSGAGDAAWLDKLQTERDNFRSALSWSIESPTNYASVRLGGALCWFWLSRGYSTEGRRWLAATFADEGAKSNPVAFNFALRAASLFAQRQSDHGAARGLAEEGLAIWTKADDRRGIALSWQSLGLIAHSQNDYRSEQALALLRNPIVLTALGMWTQSLGNPERARSLLEEALASARKMGDRAATAYALTSLAEVAHDCSDSSGAQSLLREALAIQRGLGNPQGIADALGLVGEVALALGGSIAAARIWGQAQRLCEEFGWEAVSAARRARRAHDIAAIRAALGDEAFEVAWNEGLAMTLDQAVEFAMNVGHASPTENGGR